VSVPVLGLHYLDGLDLRGGHVECVFGFAGRGVRIWVFVKILLYALEGEDEDANTVII
jgi:hypothetical protein